MTNNIYRNFILDNSLAAVSAIPYTDHTLATDGCTCLIHRIALNGDNLCPSKTLRPLRRIRTNPLHCSTTALGCCGDNRLYFLDENLTEVGYVSLESPYYCADGCACCNLRRNTGCSCNSQCNQNGGCGCSGDSSDWVGSGSCGAFNCRFDQGRFTEITDASLVTVGNEWRIVASYDSGAYLYDMNGRCLTQLCRTDGQEILTDFIYLQDGTFAMATLCGNTQTVTVSSNGNTQSQFLDRGYRLRMLIESNGEILGLFGKSYIYNRMIKIFSGTLSLPRP